MRDLEIKGFVCNMLQENCFVVSDETDEAVVIDCGAYFEDEREAIVKYIRDKRLKVKHLLCTHGHFDHCFGNDTIWREFGVEPEVSAQDEWLMDIGSQMKQMMGVDYQREVPPTGRLLNGGDIITFGHHQLKVIETPGHTPGGICFYCEEGNVLFTGDTLFHQSIGRTDFERGSYNQLMESLKTVASLPEDTIIYCGHGPQTTIGTELRCNPYLRDASRQSNNCQK